MQRKTKYVVVLMGAAALAAAVTGWCYREEMLTRWYSLLLSWDDSRIVDYSQSEDEAKIGALHRYCAVLIDAFGYPEFETQRARLVAFDDTARTMAEGSEDAVLRRMLEVAGDSAIEKHLEERTAGSLESPATQTYSRLLQRFKHFRSIEEDEEDDAPAEVLDAQWRDDEDFLVVGLFLLRNKTLQAKAADSLAAIGSTRSLQALGTQLLGACSATMGGSESQFLSRRLRFALVNAIAEIAGINLSTYDGSGIQGYRILRRLARR